MFRKLAPFVTTLKTDFSGAVDATTKRQVIADAKVVLDGLLVTEPGIEALANIVLDAFEATIKG
jgi:hypothetical protein